MTPSLAPSPFGEARTLVIKLGSAVLTTTSGEPDITVMRDVCDCVARRIQAGRNAIVVTSGAVAAGRGALGVKGGPATIAEKQALAAVGQIKVMQQYAELFSRHGIVVGQMLLSRGDMEDRRRYLNARYTLEELLRRRCVPIINENDTVTIDELKFGDNDGLAALVAVKMHAEALIIFSDVDGLYDGNPKLKRDAKLLERVEKVTPALIDELCAPAAGSGVGSGGMTSKLRAARTATSHGVSVAIANGKVPGQLGSILSGTFTGTFFPPQPRRLSSRREWILTGRSAVVRRIVVDQGARTALVQGHKSLLPAGIRKVEGKFQSGAIVEVVDLDGVLLGRGITSYSSAELDQIKGRRTGEIRAILGDRPYDEAIHRNNFAPAEELGDK
jgi:glutamate 5-kinase